MKLSTRKTLPTIIMVAITLIVLCIAAFATQGAELGTERFYNTPWALLPPVIAITLALVTKEVYSSLFVGILAGGLLYSNFSFEGTILHVFNDGIVSVLSDSYNVGILVFLVILGVMVCLMNKAGGSAAFGRWAAKNIKSRAGAQLATIALGILIFIDDYFNCLTVGSVMRPVTDKHNVSRAKLSYLIDATAAPVCIIAPISSWAAAVSSYVEDGSGLTLFIKAIPFNYYALLTITLMIGLVLLKTDFGPMGKCEFNAKNGDLFSGKNPYASAEATEANTNGRVIDLVLPINDGHAARGLQGHGPSNTDTDLRLVPQGNDRFPRGWRIRSFCRKEFCPELPVLPACHSIPYRLLPQLRYGYQLGYLRNTYPHNTGGIPHH